MPEYKSLLHPNNNEPSLYDLVSRIKTLESADQKYALRGGNAVTYDTNGYIETLNEGSLSANVVLVGGAATDVNDGSVEITPGKILISGNTQLSDWRHPTDQTLIDGGDIYANSVTTTQLSATAIDGMTITGAVIRTSSSGTRVVIDSADNIRFYNSSGNLRGQIDAGDGTLYVKSSTEALYLESGNGIVYLGDGTNFHGFTIGTSDITVGTKLKGSNLDFSGWGSFGGDVDLNDNAITDLNKIVWNTRSSNPSDDWALYMYSSGGYSLRTRMNGSTWSVDQTSV